jgi:hypothetical protein
MEFGVLAHSVAGIKPMLMTGIHFPLSIPSWPRPERGAHRGCRPRPHSLDRMNCMLCASHSRLTWSVTSTVRSKGGQCSTMTLKWSRPLRRCAASQRAGDTGPTEGITPAARQSSTSGGIVPRVRDRSCVEQVDRQTNVGAKGKNNKYGSKAVC